MSLTKRQIVEEAYGELGMSQYVFDLDVDVIQRALRRLDAMMAEWNGRGLRLAYPIPATPDESDLDELTNLPDWANEAVTLNLAVRLAPGHGKAVSPQTLAAAKSAKDAVMARLAQPTEIQITNLPRGAGAKNRESTFLPGPSDLLAAGADSSLEFL